MTANLLRNVAKASPVEYELVCPKRHGVELRDGVLRCGGPHGPDDDCSWEMRSLVRSGRTRPRQFKTYPHAEPWR
jgi:hypothetical protein